MSPGVLHGLKVLFVLQTWQLGGSERQSLYLAKYLRQRHDGRVVFQASDEDGPVRSMCRDAGIETLARPLRRPHRDLGSWWRLCSFASHVRRLGVDVLLPYTSTPNVVCGLTWRRANVRVCPWRQADAGQGLSGRVLERRAAQSASFAVANSDDAVHLLERTLEVPGQRIHRIRNAVSTPAAARSHEAWRERLAIPDDAFVATMLSNFRRSKDHATLLQSWARVVERMPGRSVLVLAGRPEATSASVEALVDELGIRSSVRLPGAIEDVGGLLSASDLLVHASLDEGTPNAVLEGMTAGLPIVATDLPGIREALGAEADDDLVGLRDVASLSTRLLAHATDPALRRARGRANEHRVREHYDPESTCAEMAALLSASFSGTRG